MDRRSSDANTDNLLVPQLTHKCYGFHLGKSPSMFPRAIGRGGRRLCASGPVPEESWSSAPVPGQPSAPAAQPHHSTFGPFRWSPVCWRLPEKLWCYVTSEALWPPCCCAPTHNNTTFSFFKSFGFKDQLKLVTEQTERWSSQHGRRQKGQLEGPFQRGKFKKGFFNELSF